MEQQEAILVESSDEEEAKLKQVHTEERKAYQREYALKRYYEQRADPEFKEKRRGWRAKYYADPTNKAKISEYSAKRYRAARNDVTSRISSCKKEALKRGIEYSLRDDTAEILLNDICHFCGGKKEDELNGIDRYDNAIRRYEESNCVAACKRCNLAKSDMTPNEFLDLVMAIAARQLKDGWMEALQSDSDKPT